MTASQQPHSTQPDLPSPEELAAARDLADGVLDALDRTLLGTLRLPPHGAHRYLEPRPHPARRRARRRQDGADQGSRRDPGDRVPACPVHPRPDAGRHPWRAHPAGEDVRRTRNGFPTGPRLHPDPARRRDQPRFAEDPVGAARGDAGAVGDAPRHDAPAARSLLRARLPESDRARRHLSAAKRHSSIAS